MLRGRPLPIINKFSITPPHRWISGMGLPLSHQLFLSAAILGGFPFWSCYMTSRPSDLAERISNREPDDGFSRETFRLPVEVARTKAREILNELPQGGRPGRERGVPFALLRRLIPRLTKPWRSKTACTVLIDGAIHCGTSAVLFIGPTMSGVFQFIRLSP